MRALTAALAVALLAGVAEAARSARQASSCEAGSSCVLLHACPELQRLLRPPTRQSLQRLRALTCGFQGRRARVCCPSARPPPSRITAPPPPSPPTPPPTPSAGEALLPRTCGMPLPGDKIHGGTAVSPGDHSWMALLGYTRGGRLAVFWGCGGTLVTTRYVLTAAHCTVRAMTNFLDLTTVRLGENNLETERDCTDTACAPPVQDFGIEEVVRHPQFNRRGTVSDDVALLRLDRSVTLGAFVQPVCLPPPGQSLEAILGGRNVTVTGWGDTESGTRSQQLLKVVVPRVPMAVCRTVANYSQALVQGPGQVCLGGQFQQDACFKDSGGPAVITLSPRGPPFVQVAVVSYGPEGCGLEGVPGVYSDLTHYRDWVVSSLRP